MLAVGEPNIAFVSICISIIQMALGETSGLKLRVRDACATGTRSLCKG